MLKKKELSNIQNSTASKIHFTNPWNFELPRSDGQHACTYAWKAFAPI